MKMYKCNTRYTSVGQTQKKCEGMYGYFLHGHSLQNTFLVELNNMVPQLPKRDDFKKMHYHLELFHALRAFVTVEFDFSCSALHLAAIYLISSNPLCMQIHFSEATQQTYKYIFMCYLLLL